MIDLSTGRSIKPRQEGIRIRHKSLKSILIVVRDPARPIHSPHPGYVFAPCRTCGLPHNCKTYHFDLDAEGTVLVSSGVLKELKKMENNAGFNVVNTVSDPPKQKVGPQLVKLIMTPHNPEPIRKEYVIAD